MKSTMPYSLMILRNGSVSAGNMAADHAGASRPKNDGPSRIPATTSPITCG
jgi:hypothetical protein